MARNPVIDIAALKHFIAVVEHGSFTRAAERLRTDVSSVSRSIKRLEDALSATLIERTTRVMRLTHAGRTYYEEARFIVARLAAATEKVRQVSEREPLLRVAVCESVEARRVAAGLRAFQDLWPQIEVRLSALRSVDQPRALQAAEIDAGVMRPDLIEEQAPDCRILGRDPLVVAVPAAWKLGRSRIDLQELSQVPWIFPDPNVAPRTHRWLSGLCIAAGFKPSVAAVVSDAASFFLLSACGVGAAFALGFGRPRDELNLVAVDGLIGESTTATGVAWSCASNAHYRQDFERCLAEAMSPGGAPSEAFAH